jgi:HEAT repeat protein
MKMKEEGMSDNIYWEEENIIKTKLKESIEKAIKRIMEDLNKGAIPGTTLGNPFAELKDPSTIRALLEAFVGIDAAYASAKLKDPSGIPALQEALKHSDPDVRWYAAKALAKLKDSSAIPALQEALKHYDCEVRWYAAEALGELKDPSTIPALQEALKDSDPRVREQAAYALAKLNDPSTIPALLEALKDSNPEVRRHAAEALAELKDPSAIPALQEAVKDSYHDVRWYAAKALAEFEDPSLIPISALQQLLENDYFNLSQVLEITKKLKLYEENEIKDIIKEALEVVYFEYNFGWELKDVKEGVEVVKVEPGGLADKAGIKMLDIITKIEGKEIKNSKELSKEIEKYSEGAKIQLEIIRDDGRKIEIKKIEIILPKEGGKK